MTRNINDDIDIGILKEDRQKIAAGLIQFLTETYSLYIKTHIFHWNVEGAAFTTLHTLFEQQYTEVWAAVDEIAERIRALGFYVPGNFAKYPEISASLRDKEMIAQLITGQEAVIRTAREVSRLAETVSDHPTADLLTRRMEIHEKNAWMLRSLLS